LMSRSVMLMGPRDLPICNTNLHFSAHAVNLAAFRKYYAGCGQISPILGTHNRATIFQRG
jgi:hypothetical protein